MANSVIFNGLNALDFSEIRGNVVRIPEVSRRICEAQEIWDKCDRPHFNFHNFLAADDAVFLNNIKLKSLAAAIVQVGLYDRFLRLFRRPQFLIGNLNGDSAMKVCAGDLSFADLILQSAALDQNRPSVVLQIAQEPVLSGISLTEYGAYELIKEDEELVSHPLALSDMDLKKVMQHLIDEKSVRRFINVGPGTTLTESIQQTLALSDVEFVESIDIDPMLSWFWPSLRPGPEAVAVGN